MNISVAIVDKDKEYVRRLSEELVVFERRLFEEFL